MYSAFRGRLDRETADLRYEGLIERGEVELVGSGSVPADTRFDPAEQQPRPILPRMFQQMPPHQPWIQLDQHGNGERLGGCGGHGRALVLAVFEDYLRQKSPAIPARPQAKVQLPVL